MTPTSSPRRSALPDHIGHKEDRVLQAQRRKPVSVLGQLAACGRVGWSIALPTLLGAIAGAWLDRQVPMPQSWTIALLLAGLAIGCRNAWVWVAQQQDSIAEQDAPTDTAGPGGANDPKRP